MISLFKSIHKSEQSLQSYRVLLKAFLRLIAALPKAALPANPELSSQCKREGARLATLLQDKPMAEDVEEASQLRLMGYRPDSASSGKEVLEQLAREHYDVVFMDVQMPGVDGLEAARRIRRDAPPDRQPRIVALTAAAFPEDRARCLEAGMDDYVSKPVNLDELSRVLERARPEHTESPGSSIQDLHNETMILTSLAGV